MSTAKILTKLKLYKKDPQTFQSLSNEELADLVIVVLSQVNAIQSAIETKKLDLDTKFSRKTEDSIALLDRESKSLLTETTKQINALIAQSDKVLNETTSELEARVQQAIANIRNGENGIVTEEEIERAAEIALSMLELPDFDALVTTEITRNGQAIRDALELLSGEERYKVEIADVQGLEKALNDLAIIRAQNGGTIGKNQVYGFIRQAIADGTISSGGTTTFLGLTDTPASYTSQGGKLVRVNTAEDALEFIDPPSGTGDVVGPASATNNNIALFDGTTGKLIKDSGVATSAFATSAQGALADTASQPGHTHVASDVTDFQTAVSANTDVAANTAARHSAVTVSGTPDYITLVGQNIVRGQIDLATDVTGDLPFANLTQLSAHQVLGHAGAGTGDVAGITMGNDTLLGRSGPGNVDALSATQVRTILNVEDGAEVNNISDANATDLTDGGETTLHTHAISGVTGLQAALDSKITAFADPNADRIVFWDDSVGAFAALTASTGLTLSGTNLTVRSASETVTGIAERATDAEFTTGTDTTRYVSANQVANVAQTLTNKNIISPINAQTGTTYTLVASDAGKVVTLTNASAITLTIPDDVFAAGEKVLIVQGGAGSVTITAGAGVTLNAPTSVDAEIAEEDGSRALLFTATDQVTLI